MKINNINKNQILILLSFLFLFFEIFFRYIHYTNGLTYYIFGDEGDGYFNLWLLEKVRYFITHGDIKFLVNSNIFCPDGRLVLFWSDNMLAPGVLYSLLYGITQNMILSYNLMTYFMISLNFCIMLFFLHTLAVIANEKNKDLPFLFLLLIPAAASAAVFSDTAMIFTVHFQNNFMPLILLGSTFCLRMYYRIDRFSVYGAPSVFVFLLYATPYYAIGYILICGIFALFFLLSLDKKEIIDFIKKYLVFYIITVIAALPVLIGYIRVINPYTSQLELRSEWPQILTPIAGSRLFDFLQKIGVPVKGYIHESLIYSGIFIFPLVSLVLIFYGIRFIIRNKKDPVVSLLLVSLAVSIAGYFWFPGWIAARYIGILSSIGALLYFGIHYSLRNQFTLYFIGICMVLFYGFALGPSVNGPLNGWNPSVWGVVTRFIPGTNSIRAIGRFGYTAFAFSIGFLAYSAFICWKKVPYKRIKIAFFSLILLCFLLSIALDQSIKPYIHHYNFSLLSPVNEEKKYFNANPGLYYFLPAEPWHYTASFMVYSATIPEIHLVNGYSGWVSAVYDTIRQTVQTNITENGLNLLKKYGIRGVVLDKSRYNPLQLEEQKKLKGIHVELESDHYLIFSTDL